jgi:hypothetical protein
MLPRLPRLASAILILSTANASGVAAQSPPQLAETTQVSVASAASLLETAPASAPAPRASSRRAGGIDVREDQLIVPTGTHLPLVLRNGINTRTAKAGDVVYFETLYPISQDNRVIIPMGSCAR